MWRGLMYAHGAAMLLVLDIPLIDKNSKKSLHFTLYNLLYINDVWTNYEQSGLNIEHLYQAIIIKTVLKGLNKLHSSEGA